MKLILEKIKPILGLKVNITVDDLKMFMEKLLLKHKLNPENGTFFKYTPMCFHKVIPPIFQQLHQELQVHQHSVV